MEPRSVRHRAGADHAGPGAVVRHRARSWPGLCQGRLPARLLPPLRRAERDRDDHLGLSLRPHLRPVHADGQGVQPAAAGLPVAGRDDLLIGQYRDVGICRLQYGDLLRRAEGDPVGPRRGLADRWRLALAICAADPAAAAVAGDPAHHHLFDQRHTAAVQ